MGRVFTVSGSIVVAVPPEVAYRAVSRPADMGRWSPENLGTTAGSADGPAGLGSSFVGRNKRGRVRWVTRCTVTAAEPGRRFAFRVHAIGVRTPRLRGPIASWEYRFEAADGGTRVTETWTDDRRSWPAPVANVFDRIATSGRTFADFQARNIEKTLRNLKRELEAG
ncbi:SRPBCC family protein [Streptomyces griseoviridis]|uniref:Polyketide cyclase n=1 Tax=Streptomyces griseoviridis TaxID=45398 RepID=A0A3S9ZAH4_STRGD|nr:SRPBCC family protein [Streptomyces griseoviridis]AZS84567.1 SRPBCC family protein [Streptomyces griseoviridis]QCN88578.1 polyketide cyclase [Streptomyces griseoviridis]